jgi:CRP-like cAMP-binding protein
VGDTLYQVGEGRLAVLLESGEQPVQVLAELGAGDVFGEMGLFAGEPRTATVRALDACMLLEVSRANMAPLLGAEPALVERFAALIEQRRAATHTEANPSKRDQGRGAGGLANRIRQLLHQIKYHARLTGAAPGH